MATESGISILKKLFKNFFERSSRDYYEKIEKEKIKKNRFSSTYSGRSEWISYLNRGKQVVLGLAATVTSLTGVIGQPGVDAFNEWIATYAGGTGPITSEAVTALQKWYDQYLKPLK
jgi:hypothetical protein